MRSRYVAFAVGEEAYLLQTWHADTRPGRLQLDPQDRWTRLEIVGGTGGGLLEPTGTVEFRAHRSNRGRTDVVHENSEFVREEGRWSYVGPL
jgi:SEC-C motif-containing protein